MGRSRGRGKSEIEFLRGKVRELQKEVKYYKRRAHIEHSIIEDEPVENVNASKCPDCLDGILISYDWRFVIVKKCDSCGYQLRKKKNG